jgi:hypothetical protein
MVISYQVVEFREPQTGFASAAWDELWPAVVSRPLRGAVLSYEIVAGSASCNRL